MGSQIYGGFGWSVAAAGDVNADGYEDIIVGAPSMESMQGDINVGFAFVILGRPNWPSITLSERMWDPNIPDFHPNGVIQIEGEHAYDYLGRSVGTVGDYYEEGYDGVIIGAPREWDPDKTPRKGRAYIFSGREMDNDGFLHIFANEAVETFVGEDPLHHFGWSVAGGFHWSEEKFLDILVGAPGNSSVYLFNRSPAPPPQPPRGFRISSQNKKNMDKLANKSLFYRKPFN
jgi:hypothetical protein